MASKRFSVSLEDSFGTVWSETVTADSPKAALKKAERTVPGEGDPTAIYAVDSEGEKHYAE
ncbi:hypothetical protein ACFPM1_03630 [Halorubrum rubrum]|uniref:Uncharacterized protein n=1 Tax=Halorubrum rubrum TaxID=1126240 RepID=A0ABD5QYS1_9EURY|nr:hypothetical protein [Halorubrum rubrum]